MGLSSWITTKYSAVLVWTDKRIDHSVLNPYIYDPSVPAAIIGAIIFPAISLFLIYQYFRYRSYFFWCAIIGVGMYTIGFICRIISATDELEDLSFLISFLMVLLAPSFLAAACYTAFSRVVWFSCPSERLSFRTLWCFPRWITPTFVLFDLLSFVVQFVGAGLISRSYDHDESHDRSIEETERKATTGRVILVLGLILQMSCFASFAVVAIRYFSISKQWRSQDLGDWQMWRKLNYMINIAAALITLRAIYRTIEIPHDKDTGLQYLQSHEWCFWVFDALPILATLMVFTIFHPGRYLPRTYTQFKLNKTTAIQQKDELRPPSVITSVELRDYRPEDFEREAGVRGSAGVRT
ncbi:RTA1 like protein-domain-containing protein [Lophiotrema nucula]|uniref:RTA1 like protein-domain-containing protein n=1 Tax=Lophiotrema nucula TaxID=690887 RepID=A0A6A5ZQG6_9PLEO|nr:RTA1 like protein-domain-containing protein [Lophiotrema nucula]